MNPLKVFCFVACLVAAVLASPNSLNNRLKPTEWLSVSELERLPALDEVSLERLQSMSPDEGAILMNKLYHLAQIKDSIAPSYVPEPSEIPAFIVKPNGQRVRFSLNQLVQTVQQQPNFGEQEVTILITGLPSKFPAVAKANRKLVQAYMQRYHGYQLPLESLKRDNDYADLPRTSSEETEDYANMQKQQPTGQIIVIELGELIDCFSRFATLNVPKTGEKIGRVLTALTDETNMPGEIIHLIGQGIGAHVAGHAGRTYTRYTGHKLRRITALDASKIFAKNPEVLTGLARGDAQFVDAIHTSAYGMGMPYRVGDVDFYPNGPAVAVPGADNIIEAAMRATRYFAESVRPGNERNFPAVVANSLQQYKNNNGYGPRAYMGIATDFDLEGDYILQVNPKSPFGKSTRAQKQHTYHGAHQPWKKMNNQMGEEDF